MKLTSPAIQQRDQAGTTKYMAGGLKTITTTRSQCNILRLMVTNADTLEYTGVQLFASCGHQIFEATRELTKEFRAAAHPSKGCHGAIGGYLPVSFWPNRLLRLEKVDRRLLCEIQPAARKVDLPPEVLSIEAARRHVAALPGLRELMEGAEPAVPELDFGCKRDADYQGPAEPGQCAPCPGGQTLRVTFKAAAQATAFEAAIRALPSAAAAGVAVLTDEVCHVLYNYDALKLFASGLDPAATVGGVLFLATGVAQTKWLLFGQFAVPPTPLVPHSLF